MLLLFSLSSVAYAQDYWSAVTQEKLSLSDDAPLNRFELDRPAVDAKFSLSNRTAKATEIKMFFPNEANELEEFSLSSVALFSVEQAKAYPNIKAYRGESTQRKGVFVRITVSPLGIYGTMRTPKGFVYLQPKKKEFHLYFLPTHG